MISYKTNRDLTEVRVGGKHVGDIKKNPETGMFFYKPKGSKDVGEEMRSVAAVQRTLEED